MTRLRKPIAMLVVLAMMFVGVLATVAEGQESPTEESDEKITFTLGLTADMVSANPFKACCGSEYEMMFLAYDMLFNFDQKTLAPVSGLAEYPPQVSDDGKVWTFNIRDDVTWSDGKPLTAHDIAFTYNFIVDNKLAAFDDYLGFPESFEAPDDTTLVWTMETPSTSPLTPPWIPIVPEHIWSKYDGEDAKTIKAFRNVPAVGSGPFELTEWKEGQYWKMAAREGHYLGDPTIDEVIFRLYDTPEALKLALLGGEVDAAEGLPPEIFNSLQGEDNITLNASHATYMDNLAFNFEGTAHPALRDPAVRLAIHHSIDKQALVDRVTGGYGIPGTSIILPAYSKWHWEPVGDEAVTYDPVQAEAILEEAGYVDSDGDGVREDKKGQPLEMEVLTISDVTYSVPEGELIAGWMNDIGIDTSVKTVSESKAYDLWGAQDFDMYVWGWGGDPDPDFMLSIFTTKQCLWWSDGCYKNKEYDQMYLDQKAELDEDARIELVKEMQKFLYDENAEIALLYEQDLQAYRNDRFTGFIKQPEPVGAIYIAFGPWSYINMTPVAAGEEGSTEGAAGEEATSDDGGGIPPWVWIIGVVAIVAIIGGVAMSRKGKGADDTE